MVEGENRLLMLTIKSYLLLQDDLLETKVAGEKAAELRDDLDRDEAVSSNVGILDLPLPRGAGASALGVSCSSSGLSESVELSTTEPLGSLLTLALLMLDASLKMSLSSSGSSSEVTGRMSMLTV